MNKDGAASLGHTRARVVIDLDDEIVEVIVALQPVARRAIRQTDRAIVAAVARVLAPAVVGANRAHRQTRLWTRHAVGAPP